MWVFKKVPVPNIKKQMCIRKKKVLPDKYKD